MKVKELAEVIHPAASVYIEDPVTKPTMSHLKLRSIDSVLEHYGDRIVEEVETEHDWDCSFLYITLKEED